MAGKVYLSVCPIDCNSTREELGKVLLNAGLEIIQPVDINLDNFNQELKEANCSIHFLGQEVGEKIGSTPLTLLQIEKAKERIKEDPSFRIFIWYIGQPSGPLNPEQQVVINEIRNNIEQNMIFTNVPSPVQLVDDIRSMLSIKQEVMSTTMENELFFMFNFIDEDEGNDIADMLSDILDVKSLVVGEQPGVDYGNASLRILKTSRLAVVFFSEANSWALPFIQQVWKMAGGASSKTPLMFIGDENNEDNRNINFTAQNVISKLVSLDLIPLEIKVAYDKFIANKNLSV